jgi:hypothetical protein
MFHGEDFGLGSGHVKSPYLAHWSGGHYQVSSKQAQVLLGFGNCGHACLQMHPVSRGANQPIGQSINQSINH